MKKDNIQRLLALLTCCLVMIVVAVNRDGTVIGHKIKKDTDTTTVTKKVTIDRITEDGTRIINTTTLGKGITGYAGEVPLEVYIKDNKITKIVALPNKETPDFFKEASALFAKWQGLETEKAITAKVDAVSGATFSSKAIIANVRAAAQYAAQTKQEQPNSNTFEWSWQYIAGLIVVLMGAIIPLFYKNKWMRRIQFVLNIVVLGLWCGTFISYSLIVSFLSHGTNWAISAVPLIMLITAFIYPLFGKKNYYCNNICPYGSIQELASSATKKKWKMSKETTKRLELFREILWTILMMLMLVGTAFQWMDYEVFSAFLITTASWVVLAIAVVFLLLSFFVPRPYCRFVCPTGTLFKIAQSGKVFKIPSKKK